MAFQQIVLPYPDFKLQEVIDSEQFDLNNKTTTDKLNALITVINQITDSVAAGGSGANLISLTPIAPFTSVKLQLFLEEVVARLKATANGASGADLIGSTSVSGLTGTTVQAQIASLKAFADTIQSALNTDVAALATHKSSADHDGRYYTETEIDTKLSALQGQITTGVGNLTTHKTSGDHDARYYLKSEVDSKNTVLQGQVTTNSNDITSVTGRMTTVEGRATALETRATNIETSVSADVAALTAHKANVSNPHAVTAAQVGAYSKSEMQTSGQSQLHWNNLTNVPNFADPKWKAPVANVGALPASGNTDGDVRIALANETMYEWDGNTSSWVVVGALGNGITSHSSLTNLGNDDHTQYLRTDGTRALTGDMDFNKHQAKGLAVEVASTAPTSPVTGQLWFDSVGVQLKVYKGSTSGWVSVSGKGALIRDKSFTATLNQTFFDLSSVGTYEVGTNSISVYRNGVLVPESSYFENNSTSVVFFISLAAGDVIYFKWFENDPEVVNTSVQRDGTLQVNLNAEKLGGQTSSYYTPVATTTAHTGDFTSHIAYGVDTGTANTKVVSLSPVPTAYTDGMALSFKNSVLNTTASTINVNGLGAKNIYTSGGIAVAANALKAGSIYTIRYNATTGNFILQGEGGVYGTAVAADVLATKTIGTDTGLVTGTIVNNGAGGTVVPSVNTQTKLAGYYSSNITINPVAGTATAADVLNTKTFSSVVGGAGVSGTMVPRTVDTSATAINGTVTAGRLYLQPPVGFWNGAAYTFKDDANFIAANIANGVSLFGLTGTHLSRLMTTLDLAASQATCTTETGSTIGAMYGSILNTASLGFVPKAILYYATNLSMNGFGIWQDTSVYVNGGNNANCISNTTNNMQYWRVPYNASSIFLPLSYGASMRVVIYG